MSMSDPIADFLTRIRNANSAGHKVVSIPASNVKMGQKTNPIGNRLGIIRGWESKL